MKYILKARIFIIEYVLDNTTNSDTCYEENKKVKGSKLIRAFPLDGMVRVTFSVLGTFDLSRVRGPHLLGKFSTDL